MGKSVREMGPVLVTGSEGYIGSILVPYLEKRGYPVVGLDCGYYREAGLVPGVRACPTVQVDLRDVRAEHLSGAAAIVHLGALSNDPLGELARGLTLDINHRATVDLANLARAAGIDRFVYASSCSIYGKSDGSAITEEVPLAPLTAYAESKALSERDLRALADGSFAPVFLRNATAYGVSPRMRFDVVVNNLCGWAHTTGGVQLSSDGSPWRPLIHVEDICAAVVAVLEAPREVVAGEAFNVGRPGENYRVREIAQMVVDNFPGSHVTFGPPSADDRTYNVSFAKIEERLPGFRPTWTMEAGIRQCRDAFRAIGLTREMFESRLYTRIKQLRHLMSAGDLDAELRFVRAPAAAPASSASA